MSVQIPLSKGQVALIDDADYDRVKPYKWFLSGTGYAVGLIPIQGRFQLVYLHRLILEASPGDVVDHVNGADKLDNRRSNLRFATPQQNTQNKRHSPLSSLGLKGVGWHKLRHKYQARIQLQGVRCHLGYFDDPETAALAYDFAARLLFGEFALCNYPQKRTPRSVAYSVALRLKHRGFDISMKGKKCHSNKE